MNMNYLYVLSTLADLPLLMVYKKKKNKVYNNNRIFFLNLWNLIIFLTKNTQCFT